MKARVAVMQRLELFRDTRREVEVVRVGDGFMVLVDGKQSPRHRTFDSHTHAVRVAILQFNKP